MLIVVSQDLHCDLSLKDKKMLINQPHKVVVILIEVTILTVIGDVTFNGLPYPGESFSHDRSTDNAAQLS
jgi:hypothetical protein